MIIGYLDPWGKGPSEGRCVGIRTLGIRFWLGGVGA